MIQFLRKIRQNLLNQGKTKKYLAYALGEIVLVVIGILLALQINNWNENKKSKEELTYTLDKIRTDLNRDVTFLDNIIEDGELLDSLSKIIINKSYKLAEMSEKEKIKLFFTGLQYSPFNCATAGYDKFNKLNGTIPQDYNDVVEQINLHYNAVAPILMNLNNKLNDEIEAHHAYLANNESWYSNFRLGKFTKEAELFFTTNPIYQNWITNYKINKRGNKNGVLHALRASVLATLIKVNHSLGKANNKINNAVTKVPQSLLNITGNYVSKKNNTSHTVQIIDGYLIVDGMLYTYKSELEFKSFGFGNLLKFTKIQQGYKLYTFDFYTEIEALQQ